MTAPPGGYRRTLLLALLAIVTVGFLILAGMLVQGPVIMRDDLRAHPAEWSPNLFGALASSGLACCALGGFLTWRAAPADADLIDEYAPPAERLITIGSRLTQWSVLGLIVVQLGAHLR